MMANSNTVIKKRLLLFLLFSFALAWVLFLIIPLASLQEQGPFATVIILTAAMFAPAIGSILTRLATKEGFRSMYLRPRFKGNRKVYLLTFFGPTLLILLSAAFYFAIFPQRFDSSLSVLTGSLQQSPAAPALSGPILLLLTLVQMIIIGPVINLIPTMGEELGWRGYLLPKLRELFSDRAALLLSGIIWGIWHAPIIAVGHNYGTAYPGYPWLGILTMIVFCVSVGIIEGYVTIRVGSAIPAGMIHSAINAGAALPMMMIIGDYNPIIGPSIVGLLGGLPLLLVAALLFFKSSGRRSEPCAQDAAAKREINA